MINVNEETVTDIIGLIALGAVGFIAGRLAKRKEIDSELAKLKHDVAWTGGQIQALKDVCTEELLDED